MSKIRNKLIRANFEAYRDLTWAEVLEPRFRERGLDAAAIKDFRQAWNEHAEIKDWPWWQNDAKRHSNEELDSDRVECLEKLDALEKLQKQRDQASAVQTTFQDILNGASANEESPPKHTNDRQHER